MRTAYKILLTAFTGCVLFGIYLVYEWQTFVNSPFINQGVTVHIIINPGDSIHSVARDLVKKGLLAKPKRLVVLAKIKLFTKSIKAGEYLFEGPLTPFDFLNKIVKGDVLEHKFTIIEGWNIFQINKELEALSNIQHEIKDLKSLSKVLNIPKAHPEGLFYPDTYHYQYFDTDVEILQRAYDKMSDVLAYEWGKRDKSVPYKNAYEALIAASLIEKETAIDEERPLIASVILNRLKKNMRLQIDPTVIYATNPLYTKAITRDDLKSDSPYNTYRVKGLPPTPIANPGLSSIYSALHPAKTNYYYFVANEDGSHIFSSTLREHIKAVREYRKAMKQKELNQAPD